MNVSTKTWLLELLDEKESRIRTEHAGSSLNIAVAKVNDARSLVEQMPEEPTR